MPRRKPNPAAIERTAAVIDVQAADVKARKREAEAASSKYAARATLRLRLIEIGEQLVRLRHIHQREGDALAGRLIDTLETERQEILRKAGTKERADPKPSAEPLIFSRVTPAQSLPGPRSAKGCK